MIKSIVKLKKIVKTTAPDASLMAFCSIDECLIPSDDTIIA